MKLKPFALVLMAISFALCSSAQNMVMRVVDGSQIPGESLMNGYQNWSDITAFNAGSTAETTTGGPGGIGPGLPKTNCFTISMLPDKMTQALKRVMYTGRALTNVQMDFLKMVGNGNNGVYYRLYMEDVYVTMIEEATTDGNSPVMNISFVPRRFRYSYWEQLPNGSLATTPVIFGWNAVTNQQWN